MPIEQLTADRKPPSVYAVTKAGENVGAVIDIKGLRTYLFTRSGIVKAVDDVSFSLRRGETLAVVGESGCGKSMTALSIMRLVPNPPGKIVGGTITLDGKDLVQLEESEMRDIRGNDISMIFQEPMTSLNPVLTIGHQIAEALRLHQDLSKSAASKKAVEMLRLVKIPEPEQRAREYPHQLSGGMRQRAMIAMALACNPQVLIADEPTTALDVTIQAQILDIILELQRKLGTAVILITHDLGVVAESARPVLDVRELKKHFPVRKGLLRRMTGNVYAVDGVSFAIAPGKTLGLVGESGCGKSTVGRTVMRLIDPTAGRIALDGTDITHL